MLRSELNPDPANLPELDPKDQFLLSDNNGGAFINSYGGTPGSQNSAVSVPHVTWLRKTEYLSKEIVSRGTGIEEAYVPFSIIRWSVSYSLITLCSAAQRPPDIDVSRSAQIHDIEASFAATENFDLSTLKHPNNPSITAVEAYDIFPDADIWANAYDLFRFAERPGERPPDVRVITKALPRNNRIHS